MKFTVTRTSMFGEGSPCDESKSGLFEQWRVRTCTEKYFNNHYAKHEGTWLSKGRNHCVNSEGEICRQVEDERLWYIEVDTLRELMDFCSTYGDVVISSSAYTDRDGEIEIYDTYRE
jgi:hypothetical protein